jgi:pilus assembly protein Flp/PilA
MKMTKYPTFLSNLLRDESGQDLIEYALVAGIISLGCVAALGPVATDLTTLFGNIATSLTNAAG